MQAQLRHPPGLMLSGRCDPELRYQVLGRARGRGLLQLSPTSRLQLHAEPSRMPIGRVAILQ
eukprot:3893111-Rhodomonas_salina.1